MFTILIQYLAPEWWSNLSEGERELIVWTEGACIGLGVGLSL